jgi:quinohemoprotein ethanol dehydrogenase
MTAATHAEFNDIILKGARRERGMPQWDDMLSEDDVNAIHAYIISMQWDAYRAEHPSSQ